MAEIKKTVEIPEGVTVTIDNFAVSVSGKQGKLQRKLWYPGVKIEKTGSDIVVEAEVPRREQLAIVGTFTSHIQNMVTGVTKGYEYTMKVVYAHFPIQLKTEGKDVVIGNFLGEKKPRKAPILGDTRVTIKGDMVIVNGANKEEVGQTAANIQQATKIRGFDPRVFQDGIYLIGKSGR
ncbi:MAG: 50S ribosomal protein L6 [Candidatus Methanoperedens sp.]|nr:50S ribosomal protein L6 [Candidatus Methanoperedens sp.]PKL54428.1 MAG: 50S ribosomal protein L6 [Candidatus Methanoperedenaceae archaeon HGW-Methanoperedenaceae-1]